MASGPHPMSLLRRVHRRVTTKVGGVRIGLAASILAFLIAVVWDANWPTSPWNVAVSLIAAWLVVYGVLFALNALYLLRHPRGEGLHQGSMKVQRARPGDQTAVRRRTIQVGVD